MSLRWPFIILLAGCVGLVWNNFRLSSLIAEKEAKILAVSDALAKSASECELVREKLKVQERYARGLAKENRTIKEKWREALQVSGERTYAEPQVLTTLTDTPEETLQSVDTTVIERLAELESTPEWLTFQSQTLVQVSRQEAYEISKAFGLSSTETIALAELLSRQRLEKLEKVNADPSPTVEELEALERKNEEELAALLGGDYEAYLNYEVERPIYLTLQDFQQQMTFIPSGALQEEQSRSLLRIMKEEHRKSGIMPGYSSSENPIEKLAQQEMINRQILLRAQTVLAPHQVIELKRFQEEQIMRIKAELALEAALRPASEGEPN